MAFAETEANDRDWFERALAGHELSFVSSLAEVAPSAEALSIFIASRVTEDFLAQHPALRLIATRSTTWDHVDLESCRRHGVVVCAVASYGDHIVAEHTVALLLALTRRLREAMRLDGEAFSYETLRGTELNGKTFGILGAGRIGLRTVPIAHAFEMQVIAHDIAAEPAVATRLGFEYVSRAELLHRSDILSLHALLTRETFHLLASSFGHSGGANSRQIPANSCAAGSPARGELEPKRIEKRILQRTNKNHGPHLRTHTHEGNRRARRAPGRH